MTLPWLALCLLLISGQRTKANTLRHLLSESEYEVRLADGGVDGNFGRVEIYKDAEWHTVCNAGFGENEVQVVCGQLGLSNGKPLAGFGGGTVAILEENLSCTGDEETIGDCQFTPHDVETTGACGSHDTDVAVICNWEEALSCVDGDLRLVPTAGGELGTLEICQYGQFGTICDDGFDETDATVACGQLGYLRGTVLPPPTPQQGDNGQSGNIWMNQVSCVGDEATLSSCPFDGWNQHDCAHVEDVILLCEERDQSCSVEDEGRVRIVDGFDSWSGRVEICHSEQYGTVCDKNGFDELAAATVCIQLGLDFSEAKVVKEFGQEFKEGTDPIWLGEVVCPDPAGVEDPGLGKCQHAEWEQSGCAHYEDVGVMCVPLAVEGQMRLISNSENQNEGRLEMYYQGQWVTFCSYNFVSLGEEADGICQELGMSRATDVKKFEEGTGAIYMFSDDCLSSSNQAVDCVEDASEVTVCAGNHGEDIGLVCEVDEGMIRLTGGTTRSNGRLEIYLGGQWGTVCDDGFEETEANTVCRQLGLGESGAQLTSVFGEGTGDILMSEVTCTESSADLSADCTYLAAADVQCIHAEDVGVICSGDVAYEEQGVTAAEGDLRLVDVAGFQAKRCEIYHDEQWGTICDDEFGENEAKVACGTFGYTAGVAETVGGGQDPIWLDNVECNGDESSLSDCTHPGWQVGNCGHNEDVGVRCFMEKEMECTEEGSLRLIELEDAPLSRLEICYDNLYGTICSDEFDDKDAEVACKTLGYDLGYAVPNVGYGIDPIWMDNVNCEGNEASLSDCEFPGWEVENCDHSADAGVICKMEADVACTAEDEGAVRLAGGDGVFGLVEICHDLTYGTVCSDGFDDDAATVVCKQLGYTGGVYTSQPEYGGGVGNIWLDDLDCDGSEDNLKACGTRDWGDHNCDHDDDAWVTCDQPSVAPAALTADVNADVGDEVSADASADATAESCEEEGHIRLAGGTELRGRVEICHDNLYGTICDDRFDDIDATVICKGMGVDSGRALEKFGGGVGDIWMMRVECSGEEASFDECPFPGWGDVKKCTHAEDAGVECVNPCENENEVRVVGEEDETGIDGGVEICHEEQWGTVCNTNFGQTEADVICRELDYDIGRVNEEPYADGGPGVIWMNNVACEVGQDGFHNCPSDGWGVHDCDHTQDVAVTCGYAPCEDEGALSLAEITESEDGLTATGLLQICHSGELGTVCSTGFGAVEAELACQDLGYSTGEVMAEGDEGYVGDGAGMIWLGEVSCRADKTALVECEFPGWGTHSCDHTTDVRLKCTTMACEVEGEVVLVDGSEDGSSGRVIICHDNKQGTVCSDGFGATEATQVCQDISSEYTSGTADMSFGAGTGHIWRSDVDCSNDPENFASCDGPTWGIHACEHTQDVGVICSPAPCSPEEGVRIVASDGTEGSEGLLEVCYDGEYGTVCDVGFGDVDVDVACKEAGYDYGVLLDSTPGTGPIWMQDVQCEANKEKLGNCLFAGWGEDAGLGCTHDNDVVVSCYEAETCDTDNAVRVGVDPAAGEGILNICHEGKWGTVCNDGFGELDAGVVCNQLEGEMEYVGGEVISGDPGAGPIWLSGVDCAEDSLTLDACTHNEWGVHACSHAEDVYISCYTQPCTEGHVRLVGDQAEDGIGRVEICLNAEYGTVCSEGFDQVAADVVCKQLTHDGGTVSESTPAGEGTIAMSQVTCNSGKDSLDECEYVVPGEECTHENDVGVTCVDLDCENDGDIRLVLVDGTESDTEGRVEICHNNKYGTVCDDGFDEVAAGIVCAGKGSDFGGIVVKDYGAGLGEIWLDDVVCAEQASLGECDHAEWGEHNCEHAEDVGVQCLAEALCSPQSRVRLVGTDSENEGRVEICNAGEYGTVCNVGFDDVDAAVICQELGHTTGTASTSHGDGDGRIWMANVNCNPLKNALGECEFDGWGVTGDCQHSQDAGVQCTTVDFTCNPDTDLIRLTGGDTTSAGQAYSGLLEVCEPVSSQWGTVCNDRFPDTGVQVLCRQLNYFSGVMADFEGGVGPIWLDNLNCAGTESNILDCPGVEESSESNCAHSEDVGVRCDWDEELKCETENEMRLTGGESADTGLLEICLHQQWGTVCDDDFGENEANLICADLGYDSGERAEWASAGTGPIWYDNVACDDAAATVDDCTFDQNIVYECTHDSDVWLTCSSVPAKGAQLVE